jgi:hypothetical protein
MKYTIAKARITNPRLQLSTLRTPIDLNNPGCGELLESFLTA